MWYEVLHMYIPIAYQWVESIAAFVYILFAFIIFFITYCISDGLVSFDIFQ